MKKYRLQINDIEQAGINFGLEGSEEMISDCVRKICDKVRDILEDSVLDAIHLEATFLVPFTDMMIFEMDGFNIKTIRIDEAIKLCDTVKVKIKPIRVNEPWDEIINADTNEIIAEKIHFSNVKGILFSGKVVADGVFEVLHKPILKYNGKEGMFNDFFV